jgi:hypothetical protein
MAIGIIITRITTGLSITIGSHCCATMTLVMQVAYLLGRNTTDTWTGP